MPSRSVPGKEYKYFFYLGVNTPKCSGVCSRYRSRDSRRVTIIAGMTGSMFYNSSFGD